MIYYWQTGKNTLLWNRFL